MWSQWLGGLDFLADRSPQTAQSAVSAGHMQKTIKELRKRVRSRLSLLRQLSSLGMFKYLMGIVYLFRFH